MLNSVRIRLTLWYAGAMSLVLIVLAVATYVVVKGNFVHRTDTTAIELADTFLATVDAETGDISRPDSVDQGVAAAIAEHHFRNVTFVVLDAQGRIIDASESSPVESDTPMNSQHRLVMELAPLLSEPGAFRTIRISGAGYRSYVRTFAVAGEHAHLVVLQSLHGQSEFLETLRATFGIVIPLAILLAGVGGYFLARRSLSPVVAMGSQASRIGAENLHERLQVRNAADELGQLAQSFNDLLDRLDQSFERQKRFVADASHELRTPVAILCGEADVTLDQANRTETEYRESLHVLRGEANRLKHIVEDLFTLARADAGQHPLTPSDFYLDELVSECCRSVRTLATAKEISVRCDSGNELPIRADEVLIRRMLMNLLDNAIKYTPNGGSVTVGCSQTDSSYRVSVSDTGQGIPGDLQPRIFERFFRVDKARSRASEDGGGAGLGLSISRWIANAHGGSVDLTRSDSTGSEFTVVLPQHSKSD